MSGFGLWLEDFGCIKLQKTEFDSPFTSSKRVCYRGRPNCLITQVNFIPWTMGVRGLCALLIRHKLYGQKTDSWPGPATLSGGVGSLAASLDYALSKNTAWLQDMFGVGEHGSPYTRYIFHRFNPERKRPGPVVISINSKRLCPADVAIYLGSELISRPEDLSCILESLEGGTSAVGSTEDKEQPGANIADLLPAVSEFTFSSLGELDRFFGRLHCELQSKASPRNPLVGELNHAWWPILSFSENGGGTEWRNCGQVRYLSRGKTKLDSWVANAYKQARGKVKMGMVSHLPSDMWIYGDVVTQTFIPEPLLADINDVFNHTSDIGCFDSRLFRHKCLDRVCPVKLRITKDRNLSDEMRRWVIGHLSDNRIVPQGRVS